MVDRNEFFGRSDERQISANHTLSRRIRLHLIEPTSGSLAVLMPTADGLRPGGPVFYVANESSTHTLAVKTNDGSATIGTLATGELGTLHFLGGAALDDPDLWVLKKKSYTAAPSYTVDPVPISLSIGPGLFGNVNLRTELENDIGYDGSFSVLLTVTIQPGTTISSPAGTGSPALQTGTWPAGSSIVLINKGAIHGAGGNGGDGNSSASSAGGTDGADGGTAIKLEVTTSIDNSAGAIFAGGGGGAGSKGGGGIGSGGGGGAGEPPGQGGDSPASASWGPGRAGRVTHGGMPGPYIQSGVNYLFRTNSGGMGGFPGFAGQDETGPDGTASGSDNLGGGPGLLIEGGEHLAWVDRGIAQGIVKDDTVTPIVYEVLVGTYTAAFEIERLLKREGWDGVTAVDVTLRILSGAIIYNPRRPVQEGQGHGANPIYQDATLKTGTFPGGSSLDIVNDGKIYGYGGWGGCGNRYTTNGTGHHFSSPGEDGGLAFEAEFATTFDNLNGEIRGGGGGGGGGGAESGSNLADQGVVNGGCGGAGQGHPRAFPLYPFPSGLDNTDFDGASFHTVDPGYGPDPDGVGDNPHASWPNDPAVLAGTTTPRSTESAAGEGQKGYYEDTNLEFGATGGDGGAWGAAGQDGSQDPLEPTTDPAAGGLAGGAVDGDSNVTWTNTGTRTGAIT